jgi:hypothetical protein
MRLQPDAGAGPVCYSGPTPRKENALPQDSATQVTPDRRDILHDLGDGLVMRKATSEDRERLAHFHANTLLDID